MKCFSIFVALIVLFGCEKKQVADPTPVEVSAIHWSSQNPSIYRHVGSSASVDASSFDSPEVFAKEIDKLLDETTVNDEGTLREYVVAHSNNDEKTVERITRGWDLEGPQPEGAGYATLEIAIKGGNPVRFNNLKEWKLDGYWDAFWENHIKERVTKDEPLDPKDSDIKPVEEVTAPATKEKPIPDD